MKYYKELFKSFLMFEIFMGDLFFQHALCFVAIVTIVISKPNFTKSSRSHRFKKTSPPLIPYLIRLIFIILKIYSKMIVLLVTMTVAIMHSNVKKKGQLQ